jgi:GNAT superfamily N-acetyltransferase
LRRSGHRPVVDRDGDMIRACQPIEFDAIHEIINDAAQVYKGVIAPDRWHEPYMSRDELRREIEDGVRFWGFEVEGRIVAVMGLQCVKDVALIRHAYTRRTHQQRGYGSALVSHLRERTQLPMLIGTWKAATWAIRFYQRLGFRLVDQDEKDRLLRRYWSVPCRQIEESVVLADQRWFTVAGTRGNDTQP